MGWPAVYLLIYVFIFAEHGSFMLLREKKPICIFICIRSVMSFVLSAFGHPEAENPCLGFALIYCVHIRVRH